MTAWATLRHGVPVDDGMVPLACATAVLVVLGWALFSLPDGRCRRAWRSAVPFLSRAWARLDCVRCYPFGGHARLGGKTYAVRMGKVLVPAAAGTRAAWLPIGFARAAASAGMPLEDYLPRDDPHPAGRRSADDVLHDAVELLGIPVQEALMRPAGDLEVLVEEARRQGVVARAIEGGALDAPAGRGERCPVCNGLQQGPCSRPPDAPGGAADPACQPGPVRPLDGHALEQERAAEVELAALVQDDDEGF